MSKPTIPEVLEALEAYANKGLSVSRKICAEASRLIRAAYEDEVES